MKNVGRWTRVSAVALSVALIAVVGGAQWSSAAAAGMNATYNGGTINLAQGWGSAAVCAVTQAGTSCFSSQANYQAWLSSQLQVEDALVPDSSGNCSSGLDLYQNIDYGGAELIIFVQSIWINLSAYSFSDELSSYKVGACAVSMTDAANGGGDVYPGATSPGSDVTWIGSAWNDRMQSVYVY
jgi:hypothetical protein